MTSRVNISIEDEVLQGIDATANAYGMNRSECISFMFDLLDELNAWNAIEAVADEESGASYHMPTKREMLRAARKCSVTRD